MIRYWFTYKMNQHEAGVDTFEDMIEAHAKWAEKSKKAEIISEVFMDEISQEIECMHRAIRWWADRGYYG